MSQQTPAPTTHTPTSPTMTAKEALAILHRLNEAVGWHLYREPATEADRTLRDQVRDAFRILRLAVHGEASFGDAVRLCDVCYLRYPPLENPLVRLKPDATEMTACLLKSPCTPCLEHLKAEGRLEATINWETDEVTLC